MYFSGAAFPDWMIRTSSWEKQPSPMLRHFGAFSTKIIVIIIIAIMVTNEFILRGNYLNCQLDTVDVRP